MTHTLGQRRFDPPLERGEPSGGGRVRARSVAVRVLGGGGGLHLVVGERVAEVEEAAMPLGGAGEDPEVDFQLGEAAPAGGSLKAHLLSGGRHAIGREDPAVAVTEERDEKGAAALHLAEADLQDLQFSGVLFGGGDRLDAPAKVDRLQVRAPRAQALVQGGEDMMAEVVALVVHVEKRAGDKNGPRAPDRGVPHGRITSASPLGWRPQSTKDDSLPVRRKLRISSNDIRSMSTMARSLPSGVVARSNRSRVSNTSAR